MKNLLVLFTLLLASVASEAQLLYYETRSDVLEGEKYMKLHRQQILDNHISSVKTYTYKTHAGVKDDKGRLDYEVMYDTQGNTSEEKQYKKTGTLKYDFTFKRDDMGRQTELTAFKGEAKFIYTERQAYDASGNLVDYRFYWRHPDNMTWHGISTYNEMQNLTEVNYTAKNDTKKDVRYVYTYYPDGSKKQTVEYNKKGKIEHTWNYDCNPLGKSEEKILKDTSKICIRFETDKDGNKIKIKEDNVRQGAVVRIIHKFDMNDNPLEEISYDSKGRIKNHSSSTWNKDNKMTGHSIYSAKTGAIKERHECHYDNTGFITEYLTYKKSSAPVEIEKYVYARSQ